MSLRFVKAPRRAMVAGLALSAMLLGGVAVTAAPGTKGEDGKYLTEDGTPIYNKAPDGTIDWYTFSGFRRYHAECHTCHGPEGEGSSYAPALSASLKNMTYEQFQEVVVNGRKGANNQVMPALGENLNVMCYLDDIYVYLKARADGAVPRGRPDKREEKPKAAAEAENACMGRS